MTTPGGQRRKYPIIGLCDCNNFFVSCERILDGSLWNVPVIVLSSNDGCVVARSNEAKALGIKMGVPYYQIKSLCQYANIRVLSSNLSYYAHVSHKVMDCLRQFSDTVEVYSIDEAFFNLSIASVSDVERYVSEIRKAVWRTCRIPVSIGIAPNKTYAKLASEIAKKERAFKGVCRIMPEMCVDHGFLSGIPVSDIWGVGRKTAESLQRFGVSTVAEFCARDEVWVKKNFGITGLSLLWELQGRMVHCLSSETKAPKSVQVSRTFSEKLTEYEELLDPLLCFTASACAQMRRYGLMANKMGVYISTSRFADPAENYSNWADIRFASPKFCDPDFLKAAAGMLKQIYRPGYKYNKCGVTLYNLVESSAGIQGSLFSEDTEVPEVSAKKRAAAKAIDAINAEAGKPLVRPAVICRTEPRTWLPKSEMRSESARYMAHIEEDKVNQKDRTAFKSHALDYAG